RLLAHHIRLADSRTFCTAGNSRPSRMAIMAMTISSSISVKPRRCVVRDDGNTTAPPRSGMRGRSFIPFSFDSLERFRVARGSSLALRAHIPVRSGSEGQPADSQSALTLWFFQGCQVPDFDRTIAASRDQAPAVERERQAVDEAGMAAKRTDYLPGVAVPDLYGTVLTGRGDPPAIGAEGHGGDITGVPPEGL